MGICGHVTRKVAPNDSRKAKQKKKHDKAAEYGLSRILDGDKGAIVQGAGTV